MSRATSVGAAGRRRSVELADIVRAHGLAYSHECVLSSQQAKVLSAIERCRTAALGGHRAHCDACGFERIAYNSCRNRHCPKCQSLTKLQWLEDRQAELLPVPYFHLVFTLPHELNGLVQTHQRAMLELLFQAASQTLLQFGRTRFGGQIGCTMILHTWDQKLQPHYHLHCLVPAGALDAERDRWIHGDSKFLFHVKALSQVFRGKFLDGMRTLARDGRLSWPSSRLAGLRRSLRRKPWVIYAKKPFAGPEQVLKYLGRYTHRVAISNDRILDLADGVVTFAYRDRTNGDARRTCSLPAKAFLARFLVHVLPHRFVRIRHYGFLANCVKAVALPRCRRLLDVEPPQATPRQSAIEWMLLLTGEDLTQCPRCGHRPLSRTEFEPVRPGFVATPAILDSS